MLKDKIGEVEDTSFQLQKFKLEMLREKYTKGKLPDPV